MQILRDRLRRLPAVPQGQGSSAQDFNPGHCDVGPTPVLRPGRLAHVPDRLVPLAGSRRGQERARRERADLPYCGRSGTLCARSGSLN